MATMPDTDTENLPQAPLPDSWLGKIQWLIQNPTLEALAHLITAPDPDPRQAYVWVYITSAIVGIPVLIVSGFTLDPITLLALTLTLAGVGGTVRFIAEGWIFQRLAIMYGGNPSGYAQLHYARGLFFPVWGGLLVLSALMSAVNINIVVVVTMIATLLELLYTTYVVQQVNTFRWGKAILLTSGVYFGRIILTGLLTGGA